MTFWRTALNNDMRGEGNCSPARSVPAGPAPGPACPRPRHGRRRRLWLALGGMRARPDSMQEPSRKSHPRAWPKEPPQRGPGRRRGTARAPGGGSPVPGRLTPRPDPPAPRLRQPPTSRTSSPGPGRTGQRNGPVQPGRPPAGPPASWIRAPAPDPGGQHVDRRRRPQRRPGTTMQARSRRSPMTAPASRPAGAPLPHRSSLRVATTGPAACHVACHVACHNRSSRDRK